MEMNPGSKSDSNSGLLDHVTLIVWLLCLAIGVIGLVVPYPWPHQAARDTVKPVQAVRVQLTDEAAPAPVDMQQASSPEAPPPTPPPPAPQAVPSPTEMPSLIPLAAPSPAIAFPVPTSAPNTIADSNPQPPQKTSPATSPTANAANQQASSGAQPNQPNQHGPPTGQPQRLTYGRGEGRQPAPEYPREAAIAGQEGLVTIRFSVDESGRVTNAQAWQACPFPLLNLAALRAVRDTWRFKPGPQRTFEVTIEFKLNH